MSAASVVMFYFETYILQVLCKWNLLCKSTTDQYVMRMIIIYTINCQMRMFNGAPQVKMVCIFGIFHDVLKQLALCTSSRQGKQENNTNQVAHHCSALV